MPIIAKGNQDGGVNILAPDGLQPAICADIEDLGMVYSELYGNTKHKIRIHFLLAETIPSKWVHPHTSEKVDVPEKLVGVPFGVSTKKLTLSLGEKTNLRQFLKTWRGKDFTAAEEEGFDVEVLLGVPAALNIIHVYSEYSQRWFANIEGVSRLPKAWDAPEIPADYLRRQDRPPRDDSKGNGSPKAEPKPIQAKSNEVGYGPDHDFTDEPVPSGEYGEDSLLPF